MMMGEGRSLIRAVFFLCDISKKAPFGVLFGDAVIRIFDDAVMRIQRLRIMFRGGILRQ